MIVIAGGFPSFSGHQRRLTISVFIRVISGPNILKSTDYTDYHERGRSLKPYHLPFVSSVNLRRLGVNLLEPLRLGVRKSERAQGWFWLTIPYGIKIRASWRCPG